MPKVLPEYKEDAKRRIIEAAMEVIAERGCEQMTIDHVAKKLGVTKGAVYWYFKSKEELLSAVMKQFQSGLEQTSFESFYNRPIEEILLQVFDKFDQAGEREQAMFFEMFAIAPRNSDVRHATREYYNALASTFEEIITREKKKHFLQTQADPHDLALMMVALYSGLQDYKRVWLHQNEIRDLWLEGVKILLKPSYSGTYGEEKK